MGCTNGKKQDGTVGEADAGSKAPATSGSVGSTGKLLDKYTLGKVLGQGAFGIVYSCKKKGTKDEFAVKMIDKVETPLADIMQEAAMLQKLEHPCIVKLHAVYHEKAFVCMVMDIYKGGDMIEGMQLHWKQAGMLPISVVGNVSKQMMESIAFLHATSVVHRDVKGDNYLMDRKDIENPACRIYLSDFGTVKDLKEGERLNSKCGTKTYWSPEFFALNYGLKVDVWAIGVVMYGLVTGRFPFKGEDDVKNKKIVIPPRSGKDGGELLKKILERKEADRCSAREALAHAFLASQKIPGTEKEKVEKLDFKPEVKESGANGGIAERRKELMARLQDAQAGAQAGKPAAPSLTQLKGGFFEVMDRTGEKKTKFEWWPDAKAKKEGILGYQQSSKPAPEDDAGNAGHSKEVIRKMLQDHGIALSGFGTGQAKSFDEFATEVQKGSSRLMLDATKHKSLVRVVDVVLLCITCRTKAGTKYLVQTTEKHPDGRVRTNVDQLPGSKKEVHENAMQTTVRTVKDRLHFNDCKVKFNFMTCENFEEEEISPSFPAVRTVYHKDIYEGQITTTDPAVLAEIGVTGNGEWTSTDAKGYERTFCWLTAAECKTRKVQLTSNRESTDISALVHACVGIGEEDLKVFLETNGVDVSKFGEENNKSLKEFSDELVKGEAALVRQPGGRVIRFVDVVILKITRGTDVLVEVEETKGETKRTLNWLPAVKRRPDENMFLAAHRVIVNNLKINENLITLKPKEVMILEEEKESAAYSVPTLYRKHFVVAELQDQECSVI